MAWIPGAAWIAAAVIAVIVLGYCAYEIAWKTKRLRTDVAALNSDAQRLQGLRDDLARTQQRFSRTGPQ